METGTYERRHNKDLRNTYKCPYRIAEERRWSGPGHVWRAEGKIIKFATDGRVVG